jgi:hypothetical protein
MVSIAHRFEDGWGWMFETPEIQRKPRPVKFFPKHSHLPEWVLAKPLRELCQAPRGAIVMSAEVLEVVGFVEFRKLLMGFAAYAMTAGLGSRWRSPRDASPDLMRTLREGDPPTAYDPRKLSATANEEELGWKCSLGSVWWGDRQACRTPKAMNIIDRVRASSPEPLNRKIDEELDARVREHASKSPHELTGRIEQLGKEWDIERWLEANASTLALGGLAMGLLVNRKWLILPAVVLPFLLQHAVQGWCPPLPLLRWLGVRTRQEIDLEKYALKALRGDFGGGLTAPDEALLAAKL